MHLCCGVQRLSRSQEIKGSQFVPLAHDGLAVEQVDGVAQRNPADRLRISSRCDNSISSRTVLRIHEYYVSTTLAQLDDRRFEYRLEVIRADATQCVRGAHRSEER